MCQLEVLFETFFVLLGKSEILPKIFKNSWNQIEGSQTQIQQLVLMVFTC